jgi:hypothetical protein
MAAAGTFGRQGALNADAEGGTPAKTAPSNEQLFAERLLSYVRGYFERYDKKARKRPPLKSHMRKDPIEEMCLLPGYNTLKLREEVDDAFKAYPFDIRNLPRQVGAHARVRSGVLDLNGSPLEAYATVIDWSWTLEKDSDKGKYELFLDFEYWPKDHRYFPPELSVRGPIVTNPDLQRLLSGSPDRHD